MAKTDVLDAKALSAAVTEYLSKFPGDLICALQLWYEGLGGQGVPLPDEIAAIEAAIAAVPGWVDAGKVRYEKYDVQKSCKRSAPIPGELTSKAGRVMIQHVFKKDGFYKEPDGTVLKIVVSEVWNLRAFEIKDGKMIGPMLRFHPDSERAKALVPVV
jgi:hypothetical protein